jgi:hypothetical protein
MIYHQNLFLVNNLIRHSYNFEKSEELNNHMTFKKEMESLLFLPWKPKVEHSPSMHEVQGSIPSTMQKKKKKKNCCFVCCPEVSASGENTAVRFGG